MSHDRPNLNTELHWADSATLLSLDLTSHFAEELGLQAFYSPALREEARRVVAKASRVSPGDEGVYLTALTHYLPRVFLRSVSLRCGSRAAEALSSWFNDGVDPDGAALYYDWYWWSLTLIRAWRGVSWQEMPLGHRADSALRRQLRHYVRRVRAVKDDVVRRWGLGQSEWDQWVGTREGAVYCRELVQRDFFLRFGKAFWRPFAAQVSREQAEDLRNWALACESTEGPDIRAGIELARLPIPRRPAEPCEPVRDPYSIPGLAQEPVPANYPLWLGQALAQ